MAKNGLPVPTGYCITTEAHDFFLENGRIDLDLLKDLELVRHSLGGSIAVRSSATCEDGTDLSMAGVFNTYYLQNSGESIEEALNSIYQQAQAAEVQDFLRLHGRENQRVKMGIVIQRLVQADQSGVVYTDVNQDNLLIQYVNGFGDALVDGKTEGSSVLTSSSGEIFQSKNFLMNPLSNDSLIQLTQYSQVIRRLFDQKPQDIEFATEDGVVYILQARRLTAELGEVDLTETYQETLDNTKNTLHKLVDLEKSELQSNKVIFSDSNFSELLPRPKEMDFGIFSYIFTGSDGVPGAIQLGRMQMGYPLESESIGFMHYIGGKPYFSLARDAHTFFAGFPSTKQEYTDTLVSEYLEAVNIDPNKGEYPEMGLYLQDPSISDLKKRFGDKSDDYYRIYRSFTENMVHHADTFITEYFEKELPATQEFIEIQKSVSLHELDKTELVDYVFRVLEHMRNSSCVHFVKSARLGFYYSQKLQTFLRNSMGMGDDLVEDVFAQLNQGLDGSAITDANLIIAQASSIQQAMELGREKVGHYSTGEMLEIRHPRLKDDEGALQNYIEGVFNNGKSYLGGFEKQKGDRIVLQKTLRVQLPNGERETFDQLVRATQTYMSLRETVKYSFVAEYSLVRDALEILEKRLDLEDGSIYSVFPREIPSLLENPKQFSIFIRERQQAFDNYLELGLPSVIRESDIESLGSSNDDGFLLSMLGKLLAQGKVIDNGVIVNIEDLGNLDKVRAVIEEYKSQSLPIILVASQMNLSHDPLIVQADGLIIENAGIVSHGAQRARELGRGAIGGIKTKQLRTGEHVMFDPRARTVTRITRE